MSDPLCITIEQSIYNRIKKIDTFDDLPIVTVPTIYFIEDINHVVITFPDQSIFNCNPRDYPLISKKMLFGLTNEQIEPTIEEYENYWNITKSSNIVENDQQRVDRLNRKINESDV